MFVSTLELISLAASNSLTVFCFCNLIIVVLLVGSSKPISSQPNDIIDANKFKESVVHGMTTKDEDEDDDDELRKRVEDFIEKTNRGWRAEKLKAYTTLVQSHSYISKS